MTRAPAASALAALALAGAWGLPTGPLPFARHMAGHVAVVAVAAPALAVVLAGTAADPVRRWPVATSALAASAVEGLAVWAWHAPGLHHLARHTPGGFAAEQASFLLTSVALWACALGGGGALRRARAPGGVGALLLTSMHMTLLGALLTFARRPLYGHGTVFDQQLGGAIMLLVGGAAYLAGGLWLVGDLLRADRSDR